MANMVTPMELYHAARETCLRLYVANGGDAHATWTIRPYPGTAAISVNKPAYGAPRIDLAMPSFPLDMRLPRWKADLVAAYTVHELLHALWTDFDVVKQSGVEGLHGLCNALEDNRIEARASKGDLLQVSEARKLLVALNAHITQRALKTPGFALDSAHQFSFVLGLVIFAEKLGYASELPHDWRARVKPEWLPLFDLALARFDGLMSTADTLQLCRDLKALAATLRKPKPAGAKPAPTPSNPRPARVKLAPSSGEGEGGMPGEPEIVEDGDDMNGPPPMPAPVSTPAPGKGEDDGEDGEDADGLDGLDGEDDDKDDDEDAQKPADGQDDGDGLDGLDDAPRPPTGSPKPAKGEDGDNASEASDDARADGPGGMRTGDVAAPDMSGEDDATEPAEDVTDATQTYAEANLDDLTRDAAKDAGKTLQQVQYEAINASTVLNVAPLQDLESTRGGNPKLAGSYIASPAKLRRHLTLAVKSPERVGVERRQVSGRLDMRNLVGIATGSPTIFRRRIEEEGREAAVTLLLDVSGSMAGARLTAAKAMALHMGDALKAAGVKFEICAFDDRFIVTPKPFAKGWANDTRRAVAGLKCMSGTGMLPAMKACAERLLKCGNVTRRILITLTDGQDSFPAEANATLCRWYRQRGVEVIGIGLQTNGLETTFDERATHVWDCAQLSRAGLAQLVKILDQA